MINRVLNYKTSENFYHACGHHMFKRGVYHDMHFSASLSMGMFFMEQVETSHGMGIPQGKASLEV